MAISINDLMRSSFRCIGQLRPGFGHSPSELKDGLFVLNAMLDSWGTEDLDAWCELIQQFSLTPSKRTYTIGPGGDWDTARPTSGIDKATIVILTNPLQPLRLDLAIINYEQYQQINLQETASTIPKKLYYSSTNPLASASLWPVPTTADKVELSSSQQLAAGFTTGEDLFVAPPGYLDAVRYHLAIRLAMEWEKPLKDGVVALANEALAKVQRLNAPTPQMDCNPGVMPYSGGRSGFSRLTGD
jgi:hypothetical protein